MYIFGRPVNRLDGQLLQTKKDGDVMISRIGVDIRSRCS
jgi:hypothetical protein